MRIAIIVPGYARVASGGRRVHYEYANRLASRGHKVQLVAHIPSRRLRLGIRRRGVQRTLGRIGWFDFDHRVRHVITDGQSIPPCDVAILTSWQTAELAPLIRSQASRIVQIAYDYEYWMAADDNERERMARAFARPDVVIATSNAVATMLREAGREPDTTIHCGLDLDAFRVLNDPARRNPKVGFIARPYPPTKRYQDAVDAMALLRRERDQDVVAVTSGQVNLPRWIETVNAPDDAAMRSFYNDISIFLLSSEYEGWGLPAAEAMACGSALITTRNGGVEDFALHEFNSLVVEPRNPTQLAKACSRLLENEADRLCLVSNGLSTARSMDWTTSLDALEAVLQSVTRTHR